MSHLSTGLRRSGCEYKAALELNIMRGPLTVTAIQVLHPDGGATFVIDPNPASAMLKVVGDLVTGGQTTTGTLPPGTYNMTATYNGDGIYPPAVAIAKLRISPTCLLTTVVLS